MSVEEEIIENTTTFYLRSRQFNGLPLRNIMNVINLQKNEVKGILESLIQQDKISLVFDDVHPNPHIKAFREEPKEKQIEKLNTLSLEHACVYPSPKYLKEVVDASKYEGEPFTLLLALGEPQLSFKSFDLSVLEIYRNDPRYSYVCNDISGYICVSDKYLEGDDVPESDRILLQTFGFAYDSEVNRAIAVFLRYLSFLSPQHQQIWNAKMLSGDYTLHPDYFKPSILGQFPDGISIFDAFIEELKCINDICKLMHRSPLFKNELGGDQKPPAFGFLIRPTSKEYYEFIHLLDKLISENINKDFFKKDVRSEDEQTRKDGKVVIRQKGTIQMLDDWLKLSFITEDRKPIEDIYCSPLRKGLH